MLASNYYSIRVMGHIKSVGLGYLAKEIIACLYIYPHIKNRTLYSLEHRGMQMENAGSFQISK